MEETFALLKSAATMFACLSPATQLMYEIY